MRPVVYVDTAEAGFPGQVAQQLFGREAGDIGLLADPQSPLVVILGVERLLPSVQRRLAQILRQATVAARGARRRMPLTARCMFALERSERDETFPPGLAEELGRVHLGWSVTMPPLRQRVEA